MAVIRVEKRKGRKEYKMLGRIKNKEEEEEEKCQKQKRGRKDE